MEDHSDSDFIIMHDIGDSYINKNHISTKNNESSEQKEEKRNETEEKKEKKKYCNCSFIFPTAYTVLIIIEVFVFLLTYIIPKGNFAKIEYSTKKSMFIIKYPLDGIEIYENATQDTLDKYNIKIPLENFINNYIKKPISIPNTYQKVCNKTTSFFVYLSILC